MSLTAKMQLRMQQMVGGISILFILVIIGISTRWAHKIIANTTE
jgi:uncharacterized membrane-anchored protein